MALPLADLQEMETVLYEAVARPRFLTLLLAIFGGVALALAAVSTSLPRHSRPLCAHSNLRFSGAKRVESRRPDFVSKSQTTI